MSSRPRVAIIGGGLAGLAAALALAEEGAVVELFEARRTLGGRAGSFRDPATGEIVDHCQHVAMGCCTNFLDFCRRTGADRVLRRIATLHFFGPDGRSYDFGAARWLPAPLHLAAGLWRLKYLTARERISIAWALKALAKRSSSSADGQPGGDETMGAWLRRHGQSARQIERFWSVVLTSALSETVDRASLAAARKVFVDGFMATRSAYEVYVPTVPLTTFYDEYVACRLAELGVTIHREAAVERLHGDTHMATAIELGNSNREEFDDYVLAVPWRRASSLLDESLAAKLPQLSEVKDLSTAPISAVHLWLDRPITELDHAVFVGRLPQWLFAREAASGAYYQVVISASHQLSAAPREEIVGRVLADLQAVFPNTVVARLLQARVVTDRDAVFAPSPASEVMRPAQTTAVANLFLAGDWTATGWPATMESAVRSGRLAAEGVLRRHGQEASLVSPDLPRGWLARLLVG